MNASQRRRRADVEALINVCQTHGVTSSTLKTRILELYQDLAHRIWPNQMLRDHLDKINEAGMMAQLYYLKDVLGSRALTDWLRNQGSVLDGFVHGFSSSNEERERDVGRNNVNDDGCVL